MPSNTFAEQTTTDPQVSTAVTEVTAPTQVAPADPQTFLIVGERAFASAEDVKTKILNADAHISNVEAENAAMRAELEEARSQLAASKSLEEVLKSKDTTQGVALSQEQIESLVSNKVVSIGDAQLANTNRTSCIAQAEAAYGENYITTMMTKAGKLGLDMNAVDKMAESNPALFANTFLPTQTPQTQSSSHTSTINTSNFQTTPTVGESKPVMSMTSKERTLSYMQKLEELSKNN